MLPRLSDSVQCTRGLYFWAWALNLIFQNLYTQIMNSVTLESFCIKFLYFKLGVYISAWNTVGRPYYPGPGPTNSGEAETDFDLDLELARALDQG